jgi:Immunity protein 52
MMKLMLAAYWDSRRDGLEECTNKAKQFFACLAEADALLANWYELGRSRKQALGRQVDTSDTQQLRDLLMKGRNRNDLDHSVIEELGFSLSFWNGASEEEAWASIRIDCGCYGERVSNHVLLDLPYKSQGLKWIENASALLGQVAEIWRPQWAGIMSKKAMRERDFAGDNPLVDWMVYVPRAVPAMPFPSRVEELKGLGSIIIVQPDPPVGDDAEELSRIRRAERLLRV